jgi:hypothetical protein
VVLLGGTPFLVAATSGGAASKRIALACGQTVTTSINLSADITGCAGDGLDVGANGITINLNGHMVSAGGGGVLDSGHTGVTVENGTISSPTYDIAFESGADGSRALNLHLTGNGLDGAIVEQSSHVVVTQNYASGFVDGFTVEGGSADQVIGNWSASNTVGMRVEVASVGVVISANRVLNNVGDGIDIHPGTTGQVSGNIVNGNGGDGIHQGSSTPGMTLKSNRASFNHGYGINSAPFATDGGGNVVQDNTNPEQCKNFVCTEVSS